MLEVLFVNTIFSLGAVQWQNQKDGLSGNKSAYLVSLEENSTQNEDLKLKWKHFNKNRKKSCLFICFVFLWGEHPKLINQLGPLVGISKQSITRQMGLCFQWNHIWGDLKLICFHLFRKCFTHLHKGSKKKDLDMNDNLSLADGTTLTIEKREKQIGPQCFPPFSSVEPIWNPGPQGNWNRACSQDEQDSLQLHPCL